MLSQTRIAKQHLFCRFYHCTGLVVPASVGGAQSRCTRADSAVVLQRALLERSTARFSVRITALLLLTLECGRHAHLASDQGTDAQGDVVIQDLSIGRGMG